MNDAQIYAGAALLGAMSGMRTMSATVAISQLVKSGVAPIQHAGIDLLNQPIAARATAFLAVAEAVADKLPFIPKRTQSFALFGRAFTGAISGAALSSSRKRSLLVGGLLGAIGAVGAAYATYELRKAATRNLHVPNALAGIAEDALVASSGWLIASRLRSLEEVS